MSAEGQACLGRRQEAFRIRLLLPVEPESSVGHRKRSSLNEKGVPDPGTPLWIRVGLSGSPTKTSFC